MVQPIPPNLALVQERSFSCSMYNSKGSALSIAHASMITPDKKGSQGHLRHVRKLEISTFEAPVDLRGHPMKRPVLW